MNLVLLSLNLVLLSQDIYNESSIVKSGCQDMEKMNIVEFKLKLIESFVGTKLNMGGGPAAVRNALANVEHFPERSNSRNRCAYCALFSAV